MKQRLKYIDCLRGFCMLMVVYAHVLTFNSLSLQNPNFDSFVMTFRMPMFFFLSGYVSFRLISKFSELSDKIKNKLSRQLLPTIIVFSVFMFAQNLNFYEGITDRFKQGYWFTFVSFQIYTVSVIILFLLRNKTNKIIYSCLFAISIISLVLIKYLDHILSSKIINLLSADMFFYYLPYFIIGGLVKLESECFHKIITNKWINLLIFIIAVQPFFYGTLPGTMLIRLFRVFFIYVIFYNFRSYFEKDNLLNKSFSYIGRHTLEIYLLHYFFITKVPNSISSYLSEISSSTFMYGDYCLAIAELLIIIPICLIIISFCLITSKIASSFPLIGKICLGQKTD